MPGCRSHKCIASTSRSPAPPLALCRVMISTRLLTPHTFLCTDRKAISNVSTGLDLQICDVRRTTDFIKRPSVRATITRIVNTVKVFKKDNSKNARTYCTLLGEMLTVSG